MLLNEILSSKDNIYNLKINDGFNIIILSDRDTSTERLAIPAYLHARQRINI